MRAQIGPIRDVDLWDVPAPGTLLQQVAGIRPEAAGKHVLLKDAGYKSVHRLVLADMNGGIVAGLWPGELMAHAQYLYSDRRAEAFVSAAEAGQWSVVPNPHIGFHQSPPRQRLYLDPIIHLGPYVELWEGSGWGRIHGYSHEELTGSLWPWLKEQGCAAAADDPVFGDFLLLLGRRQAHMRAGLYAKREWSRDEVGAWPTSQLTAQIRAEVNRVLQAIGEPRLPAG